MAQLCPFIVGKEILGHHYRSRCRRCGAGSHRCVRFQSIDRGQIIRRHVGRSTVTEQAILIEHKNRGGRAGTSQRFSRRCQASEFRAAALLPQASAARIQKPAPATTIFAVRSVSWFFVYAARSLRSDDDPLLYYESRPHHPLGRTVWQLYVIRHSIRHSTIQNTRESPRTA